MARVGLTLGPVFFNWSADRLAGFYAEIAARPVFDRVVIGEVVCGKRMPFTDPVWPDIHGRLLDAGIEVVHATLALPATPRERRAMRETVESPFLVEVNEIGLVAARGSKPFDVGPLVNVYNEDTARFLVARGARTIALPVELPIETVAAIARACPAAAIEVFAFGRLPLALSGRCYHARAHGLHKDNCQFVCDRDPDGLPVETLDGQQFLAINGIQTLSHGLHVYLPTSEEMKRAGIGSLRLSPQTLDMVAVGQVYRAVLDGEIGRADGLRRIDELNPPGLLVGGYAAGAAGCRPI